jgi:hypothetical protein
LVVVTVVVEVLSFWVDDDGLVLFVEETVLVFIESSLSVFSVESVSLNRPGLINKWLKKYSEN